MPAYRGSAQTQRQVAYHSDGLAYRVVGMGFTRVTGDLHLLRDLVSRRETVANYSELS